VRAVPSWHVLVEMAGGRWKPTLEELQAFLEEHDDIYL
jgi:hypothetical protein